MVHNGIEYGDMQLIAEAYNLLKDGADLTHDEMAKVGYFWCVVLCNFILICALSGDTTCFIKHLSRLCYT